MGGTDWIKGSWCLREHWDRKERQIVFEKEIKQRWGRQEVRKRKAGLGLGGQGLTTVWMGWSPAWRPQQTQWISMVSFILFLGLGPTWGINKTLMNFHGFFSSSFVWVRQCRLGWCDLMRHHYCQYVCFSCVAMCSSQQFSSWAPSSTPPYQPWRERCIWSEGFFRC